MNPNLFCSPKSADRPHATHQGSVDSAPCVVACSAVIRTANQLLRRAHKGMSAVRRQESRQSEHGSLHPCSALGLKPNGIRVAVSSMTRSGPAVRLQPDNPYRRMSISTTCGDFQQKNRHAIFGEVETSMKMTFHSPGENQRGTRRRRSPLSITPLLFFHYENGFRKKRKDKPRQMPLNLIFSPPAQSHKDRHHTAPVPSQSTTSPFLVELVTVAASDRTTHKTQMNHGQRSCCTRPGHLRSCLNHVRVTSQYSDVLNTANLDFLEEIAFRTRHQRQSIPTPIVFATRVRLSSSPVKMDNVPIVNRRNGIVDRRIS